MSFPIKDVMFGKVVFENREYSILNLPLPKKELEKVNKYLNNKI